MKFETFFYFKQSVGRESGGKQSVGNESAGIES